MRALPATELQSIVSSEFRTFSSCFFVAYCLYVLFSISLWLATPICIACESRNYRPIWKCTECCRRRYTVTMPSQWPNALPTNSSSSSAPESSNNSISYQSFDFFPVSKVIHNSINLFVVSSFYFSTFQP